MAFTMILTIDDHTRLDDIRQFISAVDRAGNVNDQPITYYNDQDELCGLSVEVVTEGGR